MGCVCGMCGEWGGRVCAYLYVGCVWVCRRRRDRSVGLYVKDGEIYCRVGGCRPVMDEFQTQLSSNHPTLSDDRPF